MGEFFKPLRRKIGVLTLLMACFLMGEWIRSQNRVDVIHLQRFGFPSLFYVTGCAKFQILVGRRLTASFSTNENGVDTTLAVDRRESSPARRFKVPGWATSTISLVVTQESGETKPQMIPYWSIVIPLTLISAYLLLSKPRKSTSEKIAELIPERMA